MSRRPVFRTHVWIFFPPAQSDSAFRIVRFLERPGITGWYVASPSHSVDRLRSCAKVLEHRQRRGRYYRSLNDYQYSAFGLFIYCFLSYKGSQNVFYFWGAPHCNYYIPRNLILITKAPTLLQGSGWSLGYRSTRSRKKDDVKDEALPECSVGFAPHATTQAAGRPGAETVLLAIGSGLGPVLEFWFTRGCCCGPRRVRVVGPRSLNPEPV